MIYLTISAIVIAHLALGGIVSGVIARKGRGNPEPVDVFFMACVWPLFLLFSFPSLMFRLVSGRWPEFAKTNIDDLLDEVDDE